VGYRSAISRALAAASLLALALPGCTLLVDNELRGGGPSAVTCVDQPDGTRCTPAGVAASLICVRGVCTTSLCGDGVVDLDEEECDDGNVVPGDGCTPDCTIGNCELDEDCPLTDDSCVTTFCDTEARDCVYQMEPDDTPCESGATASGVCSGGACVSMDCGDGTLQTGEECDDGNAEYGDGCTPYCKPECFTGADCTQDQCLGLQDCSISTAPNGGTLGQCVATSSPVECGDARCTFCDSSTGAALCLFTSEADADGDGYANASCGGDDCDDGAFGIHPGLVEECDTEGKDINCNPTDEPMSTAWYADCDGDLYAAAGATSVSACERPIDPPTCPGAPPAAGWTSREPTGTAVDCFDGNPAVNPGQRMYFAMGYATASGGTSFDYDCSGAPTSEYNESRDPETASCLACGIRATAPLFPQGVACGGSAILYSCQEILLVCRRQGSSRPVTKRCR
jgi:cysteine-rich repeat protein